MKLSFREIADRITGFSTPLFGVSWNPPKLEVKSAKQIVTYLEDRRALYNPYDLEVADHVIQSVVEIRHRLTQELEQLDRSSALAQSLSDMRTACRKFLDTVQGLGRHRSYFGGSAMMVLFSAIGELRGVFGIHLAQLCVRYGIDIDGELGSILPAASDEPAGRVSPKTRKGKA